MLLAALMTTITIKRKAHNGWSLVNEVESSGLGFIQPVSGSQSFTHLGLAESVTARMYSPLDSDIKVGDKINDKYLVIYGDQSAGVGGMAGISAIEHKEILLSAVVDNG